MCNVFYLFVVFRFIMNLCSQKMGTKWSVLNHVFFRIFTWNTASVNQTDRLEKNGKIVEVILFYEF
jgi:hypothetical protein